MNPLDCKQTYLEYGTENSSVFISALCFAKLSVCQFETCYQTNITSMVAVETTLAPLAAGS